MTEPIIYKKMWALIIDCFGSFRVSIHETELMALLVKNMMIGSNATDGFKVIKVTVTEGWDE